MIIHLDKKKVAPLQNFNNFLDVSAVYNNNKNECNEEEQNIDTMNVITDETWMKEKENNKGIEASKNLAKGNDNK